MTFLKQLSVSSLNKQDMEMIEKFPQQFEQVLSGLNYKSKKKRIQKKIFKLAVQLLSEMTVENNTSETKETVQNKKTVVTDVTDSFNFNKLPVKFILKTGKQYFENEQVFRFYYNQNHPEFYKNKDLLLTQFIELTKKANTNVKSELLPLIEEQLSS